MGVYRDYVTTIYGCMGLSELRRGGSVGGAAPFQNVQTSCLEHEINREEQFNQCECLLTEFTCFQAVVIPKRTLVYMKAITSYSLRVCLPIYSPRRSYMKTRNIQKRSGADEGRVGKRIPDYLK